MILAAPVVCWVSESSGSAPRLTEHHSNRGMTLHLVIGIDADGRNRRPENIVVGNDDDGDDEG
jgi:hypothetical protein